MPTSEYIYIGGKPVQVGGHGETEYTFASGTPIPNVGTDGFVFESGDAFGVGDVAVGVEGWPLAQHDARGTNTAFGAGPGPDEGVGEDWLAPTPTGFGSVVASTGLVFVSFDGSTKAYAADDGDEIWSVNNTNPAAPAYHDPTTAVYMADSDGTVRAREPDSGSLIWETATNAASVAEDITVGPGGYIYLVGGSSGTAVTAVDTADGTIIWENSHPNHDGLTAPVIADGQVYVASNGGPVVAYDTGTGDQIWESSYTASGFQPPGLATDGDTVYMPTDIGAVAIDADTGDTAWEYDCPDDGTFYDHAPALHDLVLYLCRDEYKALEAIDATDGSVVWRKYFEGGSGFSDTPVIDPEGYVYPLLTGRGVYCLDDATGRREWVNENLPADDIIQSDGSLFIAEDEQLRRLKTPYPGHNLGFEAGGLLQKWYTNSGRGYGIVTRDGPFRSPAYVSGPVEGEYCAKLRPSNAGMSAVDEEIIYTDTTIPGGEYMDIHFNHGAADNVFIWADGIPPNDTKRWELTIRQTDDDGWCEYYFPDQSNQLDADPDPDGDTAPKYEYDGWPYVGLTFNNPGMELYVASKTASGTHFLINGTELSNAAPDTDELYFGARCEPSPYHESAADDNLFLNVDNFYAAGQ